MREYFTDADNFGIQFPMDLDVRMKAVVLGAVFLIVSILIEFGLLKSFRFFFLILPLFFTNGWK